MTPLKKWLKTELPRSYRSGAAEILESAYSEIHRAYHDWRHIEDLFKKLKEFQALAMRPHLIRHAIVWHRVVCAAQKSDGSLQSSADNAEESAGLFETYSRLRPARIKAVKAMILATANQSNPEAAPRFYAGFARDRDLFLDLSLSGFAVNADEFDSAMHKIRFEFSGVAEEVFCAKLAHTWRQLAKTHPLYRTLELEEQWGDKARNNLRCAVVALMSPLIDFQQ